LNAAVIFNQQSEIKNPVLARNAFGLNSLPLLQVNRQKALRHALHSAVGVTLYPLILDHMKFQHSVFRRKMVSLAYITKVNAPAKRAVHVTVPSRPEPHRIPFPILWQSRALPGVPQIAELLQFLVRRSGALMTRRGAMTTPPASQR
jgi:hypothetical protein